MALVLDSITFEVDTKQLTDAVTQVKQLKKELSNIPVNVTKEAEESTEKLTKSVGVTTKGVAGLQEKLNNTFKDLTQGFTKGESNILNTARALKADEEQLSKIKSILSDIGKLRKDPFDDAIGAIRSVNREYDALIQRNSLAEKGIALTTKQLEYYSRISTEIAGKIKSVGLDPTSGKGLRDYEKGLERLQTKFIDVAASVNTLREAEKKQQDQQKYLAKVNAVNDRKSATEMANEAKAAAWLEREMQRANNALSGFNEQMAVSTSNRLFKFQEQMKKAGVETSEAERRLSEYKNTLEETDKKNSQKRRNDREAELRYLARATSVQMGDVAVSLAGGQNPLTVMMQQGDQLRGVFAQVGADSKEMQKAMGEAFSQIILGFRDVGIAVGGFLKGAILSTGEFALTAATKLPIIGGAFTGVAASTGMLHKALVLLSSTGIMAFVSMFALLVTSTIAAIKEENALNKAMILTSGQFALSHDAAMQYANSIGKATGQSSLATEVILEMAKAGKVAESNIGMIAESAITLNKAAGIPIAETVKDFAKLASEPSKTVVELAKATGLIDIETVKLVMHYEDIGEKAKAADIATRSYADGTKQAAQTVKDNYGSLTTFAMGVSDVFSKMWSNILGWGKSETLRDRINFVAKEISDLTARDTGLFLSKEGKAQQLVYLKMQMQGLYDQLAKETKSSEEKANNAKSAGLMQEFKSIIDKGLTAKEKINKAVTEYENKFKSMIGNGISQDEYSKGLKALQETFKDKKEPKSEEEKKLEKWNKLKDSLESKSAGFNQDFNENVKLINEMASSTEEYERFFQKLVEQQPFYKEQLDKQKKIKEDMLKLEEATAAENLKYSERMKDLMTSLSSESTKSNNAMQIELKDLEFKYSLFGKTAEEAKNLTIQYELQKNLASIEVATIEKKKKLFDDMLKATQSQNKDDPGQAFDWVAYREGIKLIDETAANERTIANKKSNYDTAKNFQDEFDRISGSVSDIITTSLFDGGKAGSKKLKDILIAELKKPVTLVVNAVVNTLMGSVVGSIGGSAASSAGGSLLGSAALSLGGSSLAAIGSSVATGFSAAWGGSSVAEAASIYSAAGQTGVAAGLNAGAVLANPYVLGALALAASWKSLFGRKLAETGVQGQYGDSGFTGNQYQFYKGGLFRSNKTTLSDLDPAMKTALNTAYSSIDASMQYVADQFKSTMQSAYTEIKVNLQGLSESDAQKKLSEAIAASTKGALNSISLPQWAKDVVTALGDTFSTEALTGALSGISAMKTALDSLGYSSKAWTNIADSGVNELIADFGNVQVATQSLSSYYSAFYTENEQLAYSMQDLTNQLAKLGVVAPATKDAYRSLVDDAITKGNMELAKSLIMLAPTFDKVTTAITALTNSLTDEVNRLKTSMQVTNISSLNTSSNSVYAQFIKVQELAARGNEDAIKMLPDLSAAIEERSNKTAKTSADLIETKAWLVENLSNTITRVNENARMETLLAELNTKVANLSSETQSNAASTAKTARILERLTPDGQTLAVTVVV